MLIYDVFYYRGERRRPEFDREVGPAYLDLVKKDLRSDEYAYAECKNGGSDDSLWIDPHGVRARLDLQRRLLARYEEEEEQ